MITKSENKKVLTVVDDDLEIQDLITAYFVPKGFSVICFSDAKAAISESILSGKKWDVLLTNYHLSNLSSVDFTAEIKKRLPNLPIILITPPEATDVAVQAIDKGAYNFILKPINFLQLHVTVDKALSLNQLTENITELREIVKTATSNLTPKIIGRSPSFVLALDIAKRVAPSYANIFISGESGSGKEVFAKFIHSESKCNKGPLIAINCSAIPENLLESELFGHAKGSFTGAQANKIGLFEEAQDGTLFLDEIGDLSLSLQAKLLRVLQEKKIRRVGENNYRPVNCRIISATHKDLSFEIQEGRFREDLYFRLNVIPIAIPPLRERQEDILLLAEKFLKKFALQNDSIAKTFSKDATLFILQNQWRGNVRELENSVERAVVLSSEAEICLENFMPFSKGLRQEHANTHQEFSKDAESDEHSFALHYGSTLPTLNEVIHKYIEYAVKLNNGALDKTAKKIGIDRKTLYRRMKTEEHFAQ